MEASQYKETPRTIAILEDNQDRRHAMQAALDAALPKAQYCFFESARGMIEWFRDRPVSGDGRQPALISLDHDLEFLPGPEGRLIDPGDGRDVARFLATFTPFCHVIVHTSNVPAGTSMTCTLEDAGWQVTRIYPESDVAWVKSRWVENAYRLIREWEQTHSS